MHSSELQDKVALVTGAANGIGAAVAARLAGLGAHVVAADVDDDAGRAVAEAIGGHYVHCDVREPEANAAAVAAAVEQYGGLDLVHLAQGSPPVVHRRDFDVAYRRAVASTSTASWRGSARSLGPRGGHHRHRQHGGAGQ
jgi:NAD(P)-dependent dehydrogenase (short-subunit alcohol dehydrogenase family)